MKVIDGGFSIYTSNQSLLEDNAREIVTYGSDYADAKSEGWIKEGLVTEQGEITDKGWDLINADVSKIERNMVRWLNDTFDGARGEGHDGNDELIGTLWLDADDTDQMRWVYDSYGDMLDEPWYSYDLSAENYEAWHEGVHDFVAWIEDPALSFFAFPKTLEEISEVEEVV